MAELSELLVRILVGWCGVSLIVAGLFVGLASRRIRNDRRDLLVAGGFAAAGAALLWTAVDLSMRR